MACLTSTHIGHLYHVCIFMGNGLFSRYQVVGCPIFNGDVPIMAQFYELVSCYIGESVFARCLSSLKDERVEASKVIPGPSNTTYEGDK